MLLGVFGRMDDPLVLHTVEVARAGGHEARVLPLASITGGLPVAADTDTWIVDGDEVDACDAFVLRSYPSPHALLGPPDKQQCAADWFRLGAEQDERSSFAQSLIMDMELRGKPIVNPLRAMSAYDHKALQLSVLKRAGIRLPQTLITNHPESARIFIDAVAGTGADVIIKPLGGGAETLLVDEDVRGRLPGIAVSPVILQERARGEDIRVTLVGDEIISCVAIDSSTLDYRSGDAYRRGDATYRPHALPAAVQAMCVAAARACQHVLSGIDLKFDGTDYVMLEANSAPVYLDIEQKTGAPITATIIRWLAARVR